MNTQEVADKLVEYCRTMQFDKAYQELYHNDIESKEPEGSPAPYVKGMEAIMAKSKQFEEMIEDYHENEVSDPIVAENFFSVTMKMDVTMKGVGRISMEEVCVYGVKDGKIVTEQFFFTPQPQG